MQSDASLSAVFLYEHFLVQGVTGHDLGHVTRTRDPSHGEADALCRRTTEAKDKDGDRAFQTARFFEF